MMLSWFTRAKIWALGRAGMTQALDGYLTRLEMAAFGPRSRLDKNQKRLFKEYLNRARKRWIPEN